MSITDKNLRAFGLDISDSSVKIILLQKIGKNIRPKSFSASIFPRQIVVKDVIKEPEKLAEIIKKTIKAAKPHAINTPYVIASLPESRSFVRLFDLPPMKKNEVEEAVRWEAEQHIPLAADQVELDWQIINEDTKKEKRSFLTGRQKEKARPYKILLTAAPKETITPTIQVLKSAGLQPVALEVESLSTARSCLSPDLKTKNVMIVDIGTNRTGFSIISKGIIHFTSSLTYAGVNISNSIIKKTGCSFADAEKAKITHGLDRNKQNPQILEVMKGSLDVISNEINNTVRYYIESNPDKNQPRQINQILVCGGTARMKGLINYFSRKISIPIHLANPWVNIYTPDSKTIPPISSQDSLSFNTVIGLAIRGLDFKI